MTGKVRNAHDALRLIDAWAREAPDLSTRRSTVANQLRAILTSPRFDPTPFAPPLTSDRAQEIGRLGGLANKGRRKVVQPDGSYRLVKPDPDVYNSFGDYVERTSHGLASVNQAKPDTR